MQTENIKRATIIAVLSAALLLLVQAATGLVPEQRLERVRGLLGGEALHLVKASGGKSLFVNRE